MESSEAAFVLMLMDRLHKAEAKIDKLETVLQQLLDEAHTAAKAIAEASAEVKRVYPQDPSSLLPRVIQAMLMTDSEYFLRLEYVVKDTSGDKEVSQQRLSYSSYLSYGCRATGGLTLQHCCRRSWRSTTTQGLQNMWGLLLYRNI